MTLFEKSCTNIENHTLTKDIILYTAFCNTTLYFDNSVDITTALKTNMVGIDTYNYLILKFIYSILKLNLDIIL